MPGTEALALMNTQHGAGDDALDAAWLVRALAQWEVPAPRTIAATDLAELRRLRQLLHGLAERVVRGEFLSEVDLAPFNEVLAATPARARVVPGGTGYTVDMEPVAAGWREQAVCEIAGSFAAMLRADPSRLRRCAGTGCGILFWDNTRSRTRTWCDHQSCGNRARVRRHRASRAATGAP